ncbi:hypothetical protein EDD86DRAFT_212019 [Gorgonomyces haynaldii]|nr:hypothetical protein EDD86DRAFT_212019 [Gorgonomyces haynaldii]
MKGRHGHVFQNVNENIFMLWGGNYGLLSDCWHYNIYTCSWTNLNVRAPEPRASTANCVVGHKIYCFGGITEAKDGDQVVSEFWVFDTRELCFEKVDQYGIIPAPRLGASLVYDPVSECLVMFGGLGAQLFDDLHLFHLSNNTWEHIPIQSSIHPRESFSACIYNQKFYVYGGYGKHTDTELDIVGDCFCFDFTTRKWTQIECDLKPRAMHSGTLVGSKWHIFGGWVMNDKLETTNDHYVLDLETLQWEKRECNLDPVAGHGHCLFMGRLFMFGGNAGYNPSGVHMITNREVQLNLGQELDVKLLKKNTGRHMLSFPRPSVLTCVADGVIIFQSKKVTQSLSFTDDESFREAWDLAKGVQYTLIVTNGSMRTVYLMDSDLQDDPFEMPSTKEHIITDFSVSRDLVLSFELARPCLLALYCQSQDSPWVRVQTIEKPISLKVDALHVPKTSSIRFKIAPLHLEFTDKYQISDWIHLDVQQTPKVNRKRKLSQELKMDLDGETQQVYQPTPERLPIKLQSSQSLHLQVSQTSLMSQSSVDIVDQPSSPDLIPASVQSPQGTIPLPKFHRKSDAEPLKNTPKQSNTVLYGKSKKSLSQKSEKTPTQKSVEKKSKAEKEDVTPKERPRSASQKKTEKNSSEKKEVKEDEESDNLPEGSVQVLKPTPELWNNLRYGQLVSIIDVAKGLVKVKQMPSKPKIYWTRFLFYVEIDGNKVAVFHYPTYSKSDDAFVILDDPWHQSRIVDICPYGQIPEVKDLRDQIGSETFDLSNPKSYAMDERTREQLLANPLAIVRPKYLKMHL